MPTLVLCRHNQQNPTECPPVQVSRRLSTTSFVQRRHMTKEPPTSKRYIGTPHHELKAEKKKLKVTVGVLNGRVKQTDYQTIDTHFHVPLDCLHFYPIEMLLYIHFNLNKIVLSKTNV